jgi:transposase
VVDPRRLVFVDECSTSVRMVPLRARAPKGERAFGKVPKNWDENVTLISSMNLEGMGASMSIEGSADGDAFLLYVEHLLCPTLERGQIVVMDNLQVHKMKKVRELIEGCGCQLVFLPSYSPDFNPIEEAFSKVKGLLRKAKARSFEALVEATGRALSAVTKEDARGFFTHRGYWMPRALSL